MLATMTMEELSLCLSLSLSLSHILSQNTLTFLAKTEKSAYSSNESCSTSSWAHKTTLANSRISSVSCDYNTNQQAFIYGSKGIHFYGTMKKQEKLCFINTSLPILDPIYKRTTNSTPMNINIEAVLFLNADPPDDKAWALTRSATRISRLLPYT